MNWDEINASAGQGNWAWLKEYDRQLRRELTETKDWYERAMRAEKERDEAIEARDRWYERAALEVSTTRAKLDKLQRAASALVASVPWRSDQFVVVPTMNLQALKDAL